MLHRAETWRLFLICAHRMVEGKVGPPKRWKESGGGGGVQWWGGQTESRRKRGRTNSHVMLEQLGFFIIDL